MPEMKSDKYLVFGFKTIARLNGSGGWDDLLASAQALETAITIADKFLDKNRNDENTPRVQIVNLSSWAKIDINLATREIDVAHVREIFKTSDMDRPDSWSLH